MPMASKEEETSKRLLAIAIEALPVVVLDNVVGVMNSAVFASALTATEVQDRLLGRNETVTAPLTTMWIVTANNAAFSSDMARRIIPIDMDAHLEDPESRTEFKYPDIRAHVETIRPQLVVAALTVLRAFHLAGHPKHSKPPMGSFEGWDAEIRAALIWAGEADPLEGRERIREQADVELEGLREGLLAWSATFGTDAVTAQKAVERAAAADDGVLLAALANLTGCRVKDLDARRLGYALRRVAGRIVDGLLFNRELGSTGGAVRWVVRKP
jgi:putative DNA primase/helicase